MPEMLAMLIGGLAIFLYAIHRLSGAMEDVFTAQAREVIGRYTRNVYLGILVGMLATILLGSSSAVIILTIVFINARTLTFRAAIGIIMGANIGTTFSSQLISLDIGKYAIVPLLIGLAIDVFVKAERYKRFGQPLLYVGLLFFGLFLMEQSVLPLRDSESFIALLERLENPVQGAMSGGLVTLVLQSSSATVGLAILLGKQGLLSASGGIAVMLGAELGTCSDTLIATINGSRQAVKAGLFHLIFNLLTILAGLALFYPFVHFVDWISGVQPIDNKIAHAHMIFNIAGVLLFLPFSGLMERFLDRLLPERSKK